MKEEAERILYGFAAGVDYHSEYDGQYLDFDEAYLGIQELVKTAIADVLKEVGEAYYDHDGSYKFIEKTKAIRTKYGIKEGE